MDNLFSRSVTVFHDRPLPKDAAMVAGYAWLIQDYGLDVVLPEKLVAISHKHQRKAQESWLLLTPRHAPENTAAGHLALALRYEGVDLGVLNALFSVLPSAVLEDWLLQEPTSAYARRCWFFYEWLTGNRLNITDATTSNYVDALDPAKQYASTPIPSSRHRVRDNLPGTPAFCPLVFVTETLESYRAQNLPSAAKTLTGAVHPDVLSRAAAFLLLKDSRASFAIEGERPSHQRAERWGQAIGQAGERPLTLLELERLQRLIIPDSRFVKLGLRKEGGFIGTHDRETGTPLPDHISSRWQDLESLLGGLMALDRRVNNSPLDPVIAAALLAFGFVFIHPFEDGNGRLHRYLIHHVLAERGFAPKGVVFPISAAILRNIHAYKAVLETYSRPRLPLIRWQPTARGNVEVLNDTAPLYRYFDATKMAEFLYACVQETIKTILPEEIRYLERYDTLKTRIAARFDMPDYRLDLLIRFLQQNNGKLSKRKQSKEFSTLTAEEALSLERLYQEVWDG
jgi:Fic family protein